MSSSPISNGLYWIESVATKTRINLSESAAADYSPIIGWHTQSVDSTNDQWNVFLTGTAPPDSVNGNTSTTASTDLATQGSGGSNAGAPYWYTITNKRTSSLMLPGPAAPNSYEAIVWVHGQLFGMTPTTPQPQSWIITASSTPGQFTLSIPFPEAVQGATGQTEGCLTVWNFGQNTYSPVTLEAPSGKPEQLWTFIVPS